MLKHQRFVNCAFFWFLWVCSEVCVEVCGDGVEQSFFVPAYCA